MSVLNFIPNGNKSWRVLRSGKHIANVSKTPRGLIVDPLASIAEAEVFSIKSFVSFAEDEGEEARRTR